MSPWGPSHIALGTARVSEMSLEQQRVVTGEATRQLFTRVATRQRIVLPVVEAHDSLHALQRHVLDRHFALEYSGARAIVVAVPSQR